MPRELLAGPGAWVELVPADEWRGALMTAAQVEISGTFEGTITVQWCQLDEADAEYRDVPGAQYKKAATDIFTMRAKNWRLRAGFKPGDHKSGAAKVVLI